MALREILANFGFTFDKAALAQAHAGVEGVKRSAHEAGGGLGHLAEGIKLAVAGFVGGEVVRFTNEIKEQAAELQDLAGQTGLSTDELQAWTLEANLAGASGADFVAGLRKVSRELATGVDESGQQSKLFKRLGIDTKDAATGGVRDLSTVLPEIAERFKGLKTGAERSALAQEIFGKSGSKLAPILAKGAEGVAEMRAQMEELGGGFSKEAIERADEYDDAIIKLDFSFRSFKSMLGVQVFPVLADIIGALTKAGVGAAKWLKETTALGTGIKILAGMLTFKLMGALAPFLLPGLKFLAIFLAVDDLVAFLSGKKSVIGDILTSWFGEDFTNHVRETFNGIKEIAEGTVSGIGALWHMLMSDNEAESDMWAGRFMQATQVMSNNLDTFFDYCGMVVGKIVAAFFGGIVAIETRWNQLVEKVSHIPGLGNAKTLGFDTKGAYGAQLDAQATVRNLKENIARRSESSEGARDQAATGGSQIVTATGPVRAPTTTQNFVELKPTIHVMLPPGVTDPRRIAREVASVQSEANRGAMQSLEQRGAK